MKVLTPARHANSTIVPFAISVFIGLLPNNLGAVADAHDGAATVGSVSREVDQAPPPTGLVLALGFDENSGAVVNDQSGAGNHGTISGATWTAAGRFGAALSFDGVNDWVTVADAPSLDLTNRLTVEAWVFPTALNSWETVALKEAGAELAYALYADNNGGTSRRPGAWVRMANPSTSALGTATLPLNTWTHLAMTYDGAQLRLFVNGTQVRSVARTGSIPASTGPLRLGGNGVWTEFFNGRLDEVRIYNRALTASEIQTDMTLPVTR